MADNAPTSVRPLSTIRISPEILEMVLSELGQDKRSLYALSLGCRHFYQASQKHIYSSILSDKPSTHLSFFRALKAKPVLGTHTLIYCSFRWRWVFPDPEGNRELLKLSEEGFALMPNLKMLIFIEMEHYNLGRWGRQWLQRCARPTFSKLETLSGNEDVMELFMTTSLVTRLRWEDEPSATFLSQDTVRHISQQLDRVEALSLASFWHTTSIQKIGMHLQSLRVLQLAGPYALQELDFLKSFPNLSHVFVVVDFRFELEEPEDQEGLIEGLFTTCPNLEVAYLRDKIYHVYRKWICGVQQEGYRFRSEIETVQRQLMWK